MTGQPTTRTCGMPKIAGQYTTKFGQTLAKAAPNLFTFVLYDIEPTNNHSESAMRFVVGNRSVHMQICSLRGTSLYCELRQHII